MTPSHSRNPSEETTASSASTSASASYQVILEHLLQYPGNYEIPLRTMYTLNCAPRAQPLPRSTSRAPTPTGNADDWSEPGSAAAHFSSALMNQITSLPSQPCSLPPSFIISFVSRCFVPDIAQVDFPQALTALDYLRDLETRRRKEVAAAFERLTIHPETFASDLQAIAERYPGIALWIKNMEGKNKKAEAYYAQIFLGLRRWTMINELSLQPFNKLNCTAMLNTLMPPRPSPDAKLPAPMLSHQLLTDERQAFFDYIRLVQKKGHRVLGSLIDQGKGAEDENGWVPIQKALDKYLRVAKNMIDDCIATTGTDDFTPSDDARKGKKTDSGISFGSGAGSNDASERPSTSTSVLDNSVPISPVESKAPQKGLSTLERITREFKRMRVKTRPDVEEIVRIHKDAAPAEYLPATGANAGRKSVKKARSFANLGNLRGANPSLTSLVSGRKADEPFDVNAMRDKRLAYETQVAKAKAELKN